MPTSARMRPIRMICLVAVMASACCARGHAATNAPAFVVESGLVSDQVLQRDASDRAQVTVRGKATHSGASAVELRVVRRHIVVEPFEWARAANVKDGKWQAEIKNIPLGGPYELQFRLLDESNAVLATTEIHGILVGDLWVLSGQSNMVGNGRLVDLEPPHELVHNFNMRDEWEVAEEPLHSLAESINEANWRNAGHLRPLWARPDQPTTGPLEGEDRKRFRRNRQHGTGLALTFAKRIVTETGIPIGLIPCAHGGTSIGPAGWDPARKDQGRKSLYGAQFARVQAVGGKVKGVLWHQGEADAFGANAEAYGERFRNLVAKMRTDYNQPDLPFYYVQIGCYVTEDPGLWNKIQETQRLAEASIPHVGMVVSIDQPLDDIIHVSGAGLKTLGERLAKRVLHDVYPQAEKYRDLKTGPRPVRAFVQVEQGKLDPWSGERRTLTLEFSGVNGRLQAEGRISGFSLRSADGSQEVPAIFRAIVDRSNPHRVLLELGRGIPNKPLPPGTKLWYGWGTNPYCNLTDEAGFAVPVFGPLEIEGIEKP